jgi:hypothetical protein
MTVQELIDDLMSLGDEAMDLPLQIGTSANWRDFTWNNVMYRANGVFIIEQENS